MRTAAHRRAAARTPDAVAFPVLGRALRARGLPPEVGEWLRHQWCFVEHAPPPHSFRIAIRGLDADPAGRGDDGHGRSIDLPEIGLRCVDDGRGWMIGGADAGLRLRITGRGARVAIWGWKARAGDRLYPALFLALTEALRASGLVPLHASIVSRNGGATAFLGPGGTGKSTTLLRAVRAGWSPLAEDFAWLEPESRMVYGWDHGLSLWPGTCARFAPELDTAPWAERGDGKRFLPWNGLPVPVVRRAVLTRVVRLERFGGEATEWAPLPPAHAVGALWEAAGAPLSPAARRATARALASLAGRVDARRLVLGRAPPPL